MLSHLYFYLFLKFLHFQYAIKLAGDLKLLINFQFYRRSYHTYLHFQIKYQDHSCEE